MIDASFNNEKEVMKIKGLSLHDVGGIESLVLDNLNPQMNIICGENGVGKTNILDSIAACFSEFDKNNIKKKSGSETGRVFLETNLDNQPIQINLIEFKPNESDDYLYNQHYANNKKALLYLKTNRGITYKKVNSIDADPDATHRSRNNSSGITNDDIKNWLLNRILHSGHENHLSDTQITNLELAKNCFSILNENYKYSRLDTSNELFISSPTGDIYFEYLSSGFKSTMFILLGIIKEIDYRFENNRIAAEDYDGVILIDEIELHLHPEWQGKICSALKETFPKAQFFITTHSPHVIQTALANEVIALERVDGDVVKRELPVSEYGYRGWTVEEILKDVMGMRDLRTEEYELVRKEFVNAFKHQNYDEAKQAFVKIEKMLHPSSELKTIYQMQLDSLGD